MKPEHKFYLMINGGEYYTYIRVFADKISYGWSTEGDRRMKLQWNSHLDGDFIIADFTRIDIPTAFEYHGIEE